MSRDVFVLGLPVYSFCLRAVVLIAPGMLILLGGQSPPQVSSETARLSEMVGQALYPDNPVSLLAYAVLICLPGVFFVLAADLLGEFTFAKMMPMSKTPTAIWQVLGYAVSIAASAFAALRLVSG